LREQLSDIEITVLSQSPASTKDKYGVDSIDRKSLWKVMKAIKNHDLLISGGGSLLQDVTSRKSIYYYLAIMWMACFFRKDFFIYSQGIGPIYSRWNRVLTGKTLKKASGIVVRDQASKELLKEMGVPQERVIITADPVLRIEPVSLEIGKKILENEGFQREPGRKVVGFAIKEKQLDSPFVKELEKSIRVLVEEKNCQVVLIPFHYKEDVQVIEEMERRLSNRVFAVKNKYLTNEMLSLIGNMDVLVGVRLHALIHGAIMGVKLIGVSYDPKINAFLGSIGLKALSTTLDFQTRFFLEEMERLWEPDYEETEKIVKVRVKELVRSLSINEEMIQKIIDGRRAKSQ